MIKENNTETLSGIKNIFGMVSLKIIGDEGFMREETLYLPPCIEIYTHKYKDVEFVNAERLINYRYIVQEYLQLLIDKTDIEKRIGTLKGIDYDRIKVQTGNGLKTSEQEHYAMKLERINKLIWGYQGWLPDEQKIIKNQLLRLTKPLYIELLTAYYINGKKWAVILDEKLGTRIDFQENYHNYWKTLMEWRKSALKQLEEISSKPYVPALNQLSLISGKDK